MHEGYNEAILHRYDWLVSGSLCTSGCTTCKTKDAIKQHKALAVTQKYKGS